MTLDTDLTPDVTPDAPHGSGHVVDVTWRPDAHLIEQDGDLLVVRPRRGVRLRGLSEPVRVALQRLDERAVPLDELSAALGGPGATDSVLRRCAGLVRFETSVGGHGIAWESVDGRLPDTALHLVAARSPVSTTVDGLSRFAIAQFRGGSGGAVVLESPRSSLRILLTPEGLTALHRWVARPEFVGTPLGRLLLDAGFLADDRERTGPVAQWDLHDALLHRRSRVGAYDGPFGGIFPYLGVTDPAPALAPPRGRCVPLPVPDWETIRGRDLTLSEAMEERRSVRAWAEQPMTVDELAEFLFRVARVRSLRPPQPGTPYETSSRPYPGGGASYELEVFLAVNRVDGLPPGLYRYVPEQHGLELVSDDPRVLQGVADRARVSTGGAPAPEAICLLGARFARVMWKYKAIAYSVVLKHAGVVYQTAYLVATAMGLGVCGLGSGDAHQLEDVLGQDGFELAGVGEFMLGRPADTSVSPAAWQFVGARS